jgi:thiol-disulfide isomerase/thioredoxin
MIMQAAQQLEYSGRVENAGELYSKAETATQETEFATQIGPELASAKKRLALIGEPFEVTGQVIGGKEIDWSSYKDKVVLVDFWATWCGPCLREVPNIKKNFVRFQELGFEVVGINLDDDLATVEKFLADNPLPWDTVVGESDSEFGFDNPNAKRCGVQAIPFLVLVGKDGNVAALHVRDKLLDEKLIELLGEPEEEVLEIADPNDDDAE